MINPEEKTMTIDADFVAFPKIPRLNRGMIVSEKIDGTNAQVWVHLADADNDNAPHFATTVEYDGARYYIGAASRTRWIKPESDNFGFAAWVRENATELVKLGPGRHYGEWWGLGIQRGYGLHGRQFSLFNTGRWSDERPACCGVVPVLFAGQFDNAVIAATIEDLRFNGSKAAPGFMKPEGIVAWHAATRQFFKVTIEGDDAPKSLAA